LRLRRGLARRIGVDLTHSQSRYLDALRQTVQPGARWLDVGCGHQIAPDWAGTETDQRELASRAALFAGADLDLSIREHALLELGVFASAAKLPFRDGTFDVVSANMVVEHLDDPAQVFREIRRTLAPGGKLIFHTPNYWNYGVLAASFVPDRLKRLIIGVLERREDKDIFPTYYRANTMERVQTTAKAAGFPAARIQTTQSTGMFQFLGPVGVLEIPFLKLLSWSGAIVGRATLIVVATKSGD
jgi:SAM-dependent methyltransferase